MRSRVLVAAAIAALTAAAASAQDFAKQLNGPWGRVDLNWQPYTGVLSKYSCPASGVRDASTVGLLGDGGAMWIESEVTGTLKIHESAAQQKVYTFLGMQSPTSALYRERGVMRVLTLVAPDRLSDDKSPAVPGLPATHFVRCKKKT